MNGRAWYETHFTLFIDSLHVVALSDTTWTLADENVPCTDTCSYEDKYLMPNGENGEDFASGIGVSTFVGRNVLLVHLQNAHSRLRITSLANAGLLIDANQDAIGQALEVFDYLGHRVVHEIYNGSPIRLATLRPACYFARLGEETVKFVVLQ